MALTSFSFDSITRASSSWFIWYVYTEWCGGSFTWFTNLIKQEAKGLKRDAKFRAEFCCSHGIYFSELFVEPFETLSKCVFYRPKQLLLLS